ncbi:Pycsar system effector family protein [Mesorhizobium sp. KR1-2]|uniref:Pycsar system effector family protein n=1 Tax=Mesorhizobium sp. KR1-2 TaxID=3156609 RepID=UPI0032B31CDE
MDDIVNFDTAVVGSNANELTHGNDYFDHLKKINDVFYDQIKIADQKAAYIFTFMIAFIITSTEGRAAFQWQRYIDADFPIAIFSACMALAAIFSLIAAIIVVLPRRVGRSTSLFWGGWDANRTALLAASERNDMEFLFNEYLGNVDNLSLIAKAKYRFVSLAFRGLIAMVLAYALLLTASGRT